MNEHRILKSPVEGVNMQAQRARHLASMSVVKFLDGFTGIILRHDIYYTATHHCTLAGEC